MSFVSLMKNVKISTCLRYKYTVRDNSRVVQIRNAHIAGSRIISSPYKDIDILNCTLGEYIWRNVDKWPHKTALECSVTGASYSYSQAQITSRTFGASLRTKMALKDKDIVAIILPNIPEFALATLGVLQAGCIVLPINPLLKSGEICHLLNRSDAKLIITTNKNYTIISNALHGIERRIPVVVVKNSEADAPRDTINFTELAEDTNVDTKCLQDNKTTIHDLAFVAFTSGTTAEPKCIEITNRNVVASCEQAANENISIIKPTTRDFQDTSLCVLPFYHAYGLFYTLLSKLALGCKIVTVPQFQPDSFLSALLQHRPSFLQLVPPIVHFLGEYPPVTAEHLASVRTVLTGAAPLAPADIERLRGKFKHNLAIIQAYGMTETAGAVCMQEPNNVKIGSIGHPVPNTQCKVVSLDNPDVDLDQLQLGEIYVRGPQVMRGYRDNPKANEESFAAGGWFKTGDLGYYDVTNELYISDRLKDVMKVKGFLVSPAELESVLRDHELVADAAVIGVPHARFGESPKAFVVQKTGKHALNKEELIKHVAQRVANYKQVADVEFVDCLPRNGTGKILKKQIRQMYVK